TAPRGGVTVYTGVIDTRTAPRSFSVRCHGIPILFNEQDGYPGFSVAIFFIEEDGIPLSANHRKVIFVIAEDNLARVIARVHPIPSHPIEQGYLVKTIKITLLG